MPDRVLKLSIQLSQMLNDEVSTATTDGQEFTAALRLLAVNKASEEFIKAACAKSHETIEAELWDMLTPVDIAADSSGDDYAVFNLPAAYIKAVSVNVKSGAHIVWSPPSSFWSVRGGYNTEDTYKFEDETQFRWTQLGSSIYVVPLTDAPTDIRVLALQNHQDLTYVSSGDIIVPARYDTDLLKSAYAFITALLPTQ